ncbi:MAG TPA: hypothetical protein VG033_10050 [Candidatus Acidoferrales bacterium]|nr:hypothetical protein [Candidatus Acidoferrales bacterium]
MLGVPMRPPEVFEVCLERYRALRALIDGKIRATDMASPSGGYHWRPERARAAEYLADFEMAGWRALRRPMWAGRRRLFLIYFVRGVEYRRAIALVGVPSGTFDYWTQQVKQSVGRELERAGLFPPSRYFRCRG